jgi:hypothetical protein
MIDLKVEITKRVSSFLINLVKPTLNRNVNK